jgi:hypothetical protein
VGIRLVRKKVNTCKGTVAAMKAMNELTQYLNPCESRQALKCENKFARLGTASEYPTRTSEEKWTMCFVAPNSAASIAHVISSR